MELTLSYLDYDCSIFGVYAGQKRVVYPNTGLCVLSVLLVMANVLAYGYRTVYYSKK